MITITAYYETPEGNTIEVNLEAFAHMRTPVKKVDVLKHVRIKTRREPILWQHPWFKCRDWVVEATGLQDTKIGFSFEFLKQVHRTKPDEIDGHQVYTFQIEPTPEIEKVYLVNDATGTRYLDKNLKLIKKEMALAIIKKKLSAKAE